MSTKTKTVRCAVYCRKSSDEGLEQSFNSLDAQRESCLALIASRRSLGWEVIQNLYDDGGFSGGSTDRPALQRLMQDIDVGGIDVVVVYRLDRLTRSLRDFGALMENFERRGVSVVSTTESLDSSTSSGRLMVHMILSFAQYEREVASERTRHKIEASRKRGLWTGGRPILGYDIVDSRLVVNEREACLVRDIFDAYLRLRSIAAVGAELGQRGARGKSWASRGGREMGGAIFHKSRLHKLLTSPLVVGRVPYKGATYQGVHEPIVDEGVFARVQALLAENGRSGASLTRNTHCGLLKGLLVCGACGTEMVHTSTRSKRGVVHRYYTCKSRHLAAGTRCRGGSLPADEFEMMVVEKSREILSSPSLTVMVADLLRARREDRRRDREARLILARQQLEAAVRTGAGAAEARASVERLERDEEGQTSGFDPAMAGDPGAFEQVWALLHPRERAELLRLLVRRIVYEGGRGRVEIDYHDMGEGAAPAGEEAA